MPAAQGTSVVFPTCRNEVLLKLRRSYQRSGRRTNLGCLVVSVYSASFLQAEERDECLRADEGEGSTREQAGVRVEPVRKPIKVCTHLATYQQYDAKWYQQDETSNRHPSTTICWFREASTIKVFLIRLVFSLQYFISTC